VADLIISARRSETESRFQKIKGLLGDAAKLANGKACVYVTGSFGRSEASPFSDLDLFIVGRTIGGRRALGNLDEICIKADLVEATRKLNIPDFSGDGEYLAHYEIAKLVAALGTPQDDADNTFTARLLLLLESRALIGEDVYDEAIDNVIAAYWRDYEDHKNEFIPAFLSNDILRLWRTFCVNYEANTRTEPPDKKAKRKLKNYKLKHSRLLTCYSALAYLLGVYTVRNTVTPLDTREMVQMRPTERLEYLLKEKEFESAHSKITELINCYEKFLEKTNVEEKTLVEQFLQPNSSKEFFLQVNQFGDLVSELLYLIGGRSRLYRLLVV
jgi:predicted nucleotidyltransferase